MRLPAKFLIYDTEILIGRVGFHRDLLPPNFNMELIYGGGLFTIDNDKKTIVLYGESEQFGVFCKTRALEFPFERDILQDYTRKIQRYENE